MAITGAALQAALAGPTEPFRVQVMRELAPYGSTLQYWLIHGGSLYRGRVRKVSTTASDNAATQATAVLNALALGVAP